MSRKYLYTNTIPLLQANYSNITQVALTGKNNGRKPKMPRLPQHVHIKVQLKKQVKGVDFHCWQLYCKSQHPRTSPVRKNRPRRCFSFTYTKKKKSPPSSSCSEISLATCAAVKKYVSQSHLMIVLPKDAPISLSVFCTIVTATYQYSVCK